MLLALLAVAAGAWLRHQRAGTAASIGDRPESAAEGRLLQAALARPADESAQVALGQFYWTAHRPFEALWALQRARDAAGPSAVGRQPSVGANQSRAAANSPNTDGRQPTTDGLVLSMADALESAGLRERALALVTEAGAGHPADVALAARRAELQLRLGQPAAAVATLRPLFGSSRTPNTEHPTPDLALLFGRALEAAGDDAAAQAQYRHALAAAPGSVEAHLRLGRLLVRRGLLADGRAALAAAHRLAPSDPEPCYALGMSFMPEVAANPQPAVRTAGAREPEVLRGLAEILAATGYATEARERRGMADALAGQLPQALAEFRALQRAEPGSRDASILISQVLIQMRRNTEAALEIKEAADRWPRDPELKERLAQLYIDSLTRDGARQVCEKWQMSDPTAAKPLWLLGRTELFSPRELPQAIDHLERAARLAPRDPEILATLAEAYSRSTPRQDTPRALALLDQAIARAPREAKYRYQLGLLQQQLNRPEAARRQFLRALDLNPGMTAAYAGLVDLAGQLREPGQIALFAPVIREQQEEKRDELALRRLTYQSPHDPAVYAVLARWLADHGDLQPARAQWEVVLSLKPNDPAARQALARLDRILAVL